MLVDRTDRLERLRRTYSNYSGKSKGPYRRLLVVQHGLKMLEELKSRNPKVAFDDILTHALSVALDYEPTVSEIERDDSTKQRAEDIMAMHGHTLDSWCAYHGFERNAVLARFNRIDRQFNIFKCGKDDITRQNIKAESSVMLRNKFDQAFEDDFGLVLMRLVGNDVIQYDK